MNTLLFCVFVPSETCWWNYFVLKNWRAPHCSPARAMASSSACGVMKFCPFYSFFSLLRSKCVCGWEGKVTNFFFFFFTLPVFSERLSHEKRTVLLMCTFETEKYFFFFLVRINFRKKKNATSTDFLCVCSLSLVCQAQLEALEHGRATGRKAYEVVKSIWATQQRNRLKWDD